MTGYLLIDQKSGALMSVCESVFGSMGAHSLAKEIIDSGEADAVCIAQIHSTVTKEVTVHVATNNYPDLDQVEFFARLRGIDPPVLPAPISQTPPSLDDGPAAVAETPTASAYEDLPL